MISPKVARTGLFRELRGLATHIALYPFGLLPGTLSPLIPRATASAPYDTPVVLVHGYFHNRSGFFFLARGLRKRGFRSVYAMNYNPLGASVPALAARLARHIEDVRRLSGSPRVHLVGHSLGGVVVRWYVEQMGGSKAVDTCVTIGTPHRGTVLAFLGPGETARQMRPGSEVVRALEQSFPARRVTYLNLYSDLDVLIVPAASALLPQEPNVYNELISDLGHTSLLISPELIDVVCDRLISASDEMPLAEVRPLVPRKRAVGG